MTALPTTIQTSEDRFQWLQARQQGIGASEAAAVLGFSPYETPLQVYRRKTSPSPVTEAPPTLAMELGLYLEPFLAEKYEALSGRRLEKRQAFVPDPMGRPLFATLDGVNDAGEPVELKTTREGRPDLGPSGTDEIPPEWMLQVQQQMLCQGARAADVLALVGRHELRSYRIERSAPMLDSMVPLLLRFWQRVERREPPPSFGAVDAAVLAAMYPPTPDEFVVDRDTAFDVAVWEQLGTEEREKADQRETIRVRILERLQGRVGLLPDGRRIKLISVAHPERTRTTKAYTQSYLKIVKGGAQ